MLGTRAPRVALSTVLSVALLAVGAPPAAAVTVTEVKAGLAASPDLGAPAPGPDGNVWFTDSGAVGRITPTGVITEYRQGIPSGDTPANSITEGSDGALWFCLTGSSPAIGRIDPKTGTITHFGLLSNPESVIEGPDGNVWFAGGAGPGVPAIGYITPAGHVTELTAGFTTVDGEVEAMTAGPDGNIWFLDDGTPYEVGHVDLNATPYRLSETATGVDPDEVLGDITAGLDGNLWFTAAGDIGKVTLPAGTVTEVADGNNGLDPEAAPDEILTGPDGDIWFDDQHFGTDAIGRIVPSSFSITEYPLRTAAVPWTMAVGSDGDLYVAQTGLVDRITDTGQETELRTPTDTTGSDDDLMVEGPDGNVYFNDLGTGAMVLVNLDEEPVASTGAATRITASGATVNAAVEALSAATAVSFRYGTSIALGSTASAGILPASTMADGASAVLTGLPASTTVYYEVVAANANGTVTGKVESFRTQARTSTPPSATRISGRLGDQRLSLTTPPAQLCIARTSKLAATFTTASVPGAGRHLRLVRVSFSIDRGVKHASRKRVRHHGRRTFKKVITYVPNAVAHASPAKVELTLTGLRPGRHALSTVATYSEAGGRGGHRRRLEAKRLTAHFVVC